jgi:tRNA threonylcarbamoyladenosine dehydratase
MGTAMLHMFSRTEQLIGKEALAHLHASKIAIFGIGGVGSYVVEGLVRAGVGHFVLVDDDRVSLSNLNRQLIATQRTIGQLKVEVARERILDINPEAEVEIHPLFYGPDTAEELAWLDMNYIVDAMDTVSAKIDLVVRARKFCIPVISSMGTGNKLDPTCFQVADIYQTSVCPLSRIMRKELKKRGIDSLKVVYSQELPIALQPEALLLLENGPTTQSPYDAAGADLPAPRRSRVPGSISFVPSVAGLIIASEVVKDLMVNKPPDG